MPILDEKSGKSLKWIQLRNHPRLKEVWKKHYTNKLGRLCQGVGKGKDGPKKQRVSGSNAFFFIKSENIPVEPRKEISFSKVVCEVRPQKSDHNRTQIMISGINIVYPVNVGTPTGSLDLVKIIIKNVLSRRNAKFVCFDKKNLSWHPL